MTHVTEAMIAAGNQVVIDSPWFDIDQAALNQAGFVRAIYLAMQTAAPSQGEVERVARALKQVPYMERFNYERQALAAISAMKGEGE